MSVTTSRCVCVVSLAYNDAGLVRRRRVPTCYRRSLSSQGGTRHASDETQLHEVWLSLLERNTMRVLGEAGACRQRADRSSL